MASIAAALHDLLNETDLSVEAAMTRHFADDYRQRTDGTWLDRAQFGQQIVQLRTMIVHAAIVVLDELEHDGRYAERHTIDITMRDGSTAGQEVYLFGRIGADGRFTHLEELTRQTGPHDDIDG